MRQIGIGLIGDYDPSRSSHKATMDAIRHAADYLTVEANVEWISTASFLNPGKEEKMEHFDAFWAAPGSPYESMEGAIRGIQITREMGRPFFGT